MAGIPVSCPYGFPAVVETYPYLPDGAPFPTLLYLTCSSAVEAAGAAESRGGMADLRRRVAGDTGLADALDALEREYRERRIRLAESQAAAGALPRESRVDSGAVLEAGIGGPTPPDRVSCLHALIAALLVFAGPAGDVAGRATGPRSDVPQAVEQWRTLLESFEPLWCLDVRCAHFLPNRDRRAVIDVGTNSVRLLVAEMGASEPAGDSTPARDSMPAGHSERGDRGEPRPPYQVLARDAVVTRLGEGLAPGGALLPEAAGRTTATVGHYVQRARTLGAQTVTLIATSAAREAVDGRDFVERMGHEFGVNAEVVSGEQEARLTFLGAGDACGDAVLIDPGGGSTEIIWCGADALTSARSAAAGAVRMTEGYLHSDPPTETERAAARAAALEAFGHAFAEMPAPPRSETIVGVAGTVTTLACLALGLTAYDPERVHGSTLTRAQIAELVDRLAAMPEAERAALHCIQPGRAGVIIGGGEVLLAAMDFLGASRLRVSERDLLDGALLAQAGAGA